MIRLKPAQWKVFNCDSRFRDLVAGRRFGKTYLALVELCRAVWAPGRLAWYVAPTYKQAKQIAWKPLKEMTRPYWATQPNETDLRIELVSGGTICLRGADNYDSLRGSGLDMVVIDEYASIDPEAWTAVLRPALSDRRGRALFSGTPRGYDHFYDLYQAVQGDPEWSTFQFTTEEGGNVSREELESAAHQLDERTYREEFLASFENRTSGIVYYAFDRAGNVQPTSYDRRLPLFWSLDFNVNPMCSVIGQRDDEMVYILDELVLPDSNTLATCEEFLKRTEAWVRSSVLPIQLNLYGDATGDARKTAGSRSDWQMTREFFQRYGDYFRTSFLVGSSNPLVRDRTNCVNARLRNQVGLRRLFIDPHCKELIKDLERVHWKTDPNGNTLGEIDKSDPARTHASDALGYMIATEFGMYPAFGYQSARLL